MTTKVLSFDETIQTHFLTEYALTEQMDDLAKSKEPDVTLSCQGSPKTAGRFFYFRVLNPFMPTKKIRKVCCCETFNIQLCIKLTGSIYLDIISLFSFPRILKYVY